jgi:hypothetical protein
VAGGGVLFLVAIRGQGTNSFVRRKYSRDHCRRNNTCWNLQTLFLPCALLVPCQLFLCTRHGGGKRCSHDGCTKSAVGGSSLCTSHGGGRRCAIDGCEKSAQSSTKFCVKHGGGKKCSNPECDKVARGKTLFCAAVSFVIGIIIQLAVSEDSSPLTISFSLACIFLAWRWRAMQTRRVQSSGDR